MARDKNKKKSKREQSAKNYCCFDYSYCYMCYTWRCLSFVTGHFDDLIAKFTGETTTIAETTTEEETEGTTAAPEAISTLPPKLRPRAKQKQKQPQ